MLTLILWNAKYFMTQICELFLIHTYLTASNIKFKSADRILNLV